MRLGCDTIASGVLLFAVACGPKASSPAGKAGDGSNADTTTNTGATSDAPDDATTSTPPGVPMASV
jgi:hypothetical protein